MAGSGNHQRGNAKPAFDTQRSCVAQAFTRCAAAAYGVALFIAIVFLLAGALAAAVTPEPLWVRTLTFGVLGTLPAITAYLLGLLTFWVMTALGEVSDPVMRVTSTASWRATIVSWRSLNRFARALGARWLWFCAVIAAIWKPVRRKARETACHAGRVVPVYSQSICRNARSTTRAIERSTRAAWRTFIMGVTFPIRLTARTLLRVFPAAA